MKYVDVYGVKLTPIENMKFSKYCSNNGLAMNTKTVDERKELVIKWLDEHTFSYCQSEIEGQCKCEVQCDHCKEYYKPLELNGFEKAKEREENLKRN